MLVSRRECNHVTGNWNMTHPEKQPISAQTSAQTADRPRRTYKGSGHPTWCPACGDYSVLGSLDRALTAFGKPEWEIVVVSGIGCSSRFPYFMNTYGFHSAHGRALPVATGLKLACPDLTVIAVGGDGDALAIGGNHFFHAMRRNLDITYLLMDNQTYGMTKGQSAPTSMMGSRSKSSPYGTVELPVDPVWAALTMGASFVAQGASFDIAQLTGLILQALRHRGTALVNVMSPCVTFNRSLDKEYIQSHSYLIGTDHDSGDFHAALHLVLDAEGRFPLGLIYRKEHPTLEERIGGITSHAGGSNTKVDIDKIAAQFL